jgi:hypothetical protein
MREQSRRPDGRQVGRIKVYPHKTSSQKRELDNSSELHRIKGRRQPAREKTPRIRKSYSLLLQVMFADRRS